MRTPRIILLGDHPGQMNDILAMIPLHCEVKACPWPYRPTLYDRWRGDLLFLLFADHRKEKQQARVQYLKRQCPKAVVVILEQQPSHADIIEAFRMGAADFLELPLDPVEFRDLIRRYLFSPLPAERGGRKDKLSWFSRLQAWLWPEKGPRSAAPQATSGQLGIIPQSYLLKALPESAPEPHTLTCRLLGTLEIRVKGKKLKKIPGKKVSALLAYLFYHHQKPVHREVLMETFWSYATPDSARNSLNTAIYNARKLFQPLLPEQEVLVYYNECYVLNPELDVLTDVEQFIGHWKKGRNIDLSQGLELAVSNYQKAVSLYRGDFLEDLRYDHWCELIRDNLRENYLLTLDRLSLYFFEEKAHSITINICKKILTVDPYLEDVHQRLIACYFQMGLRDKALQQYHKCCRLLKEELSVSPSEQTTRLFRKMTEGV